MEPSRHCWAPSISPVRKSAQATQQVKEDYEYVLLHRGTLRSIVGLDKPAGALVDRSIYEFAIHRPRLVRN